MSNYNFVAYKEQHINIILVSEKMPSLKKKSLGDMTPERLRGNERLRGERLGENGLYINVLESKSQSVLTPQLDRV